MKKTGVTMPIEAKGVKSDLQDALIATEYKGKWGFKNKCGLEVIPCKYDEVWSFSEGIVRVKVNGKYGFINMEGIDIIPCMFDDTGFLSEGLIFVELAGKSGFYDRTGHEVVPCKYDYVHDFSQGFAIVSIADKCGVIDQTGQEVCPCKYDVIEDFSGGFARVLKEGKWGFINETGQEVVPCRFEFAQDFFNGFAYAELILPSSETYTVQYMSLGRFVIDKCVFDYLMEALNGYSQELDLNRTYQLTEYQCRVNNFLSEDEINELRALPPLPRQIHLKHIMAEKLNGDFENWEINEWIVHEWGKIPRFQIGQHDRITRFRDNLQDGFTSSLDNISSLSKIASFVQPSEYFVYDSRVAFAIDGILLNYHKNNPSANVCFFPIPKAQSNRKQRMELLIQQAITHPVFIAEKDSYVFYNNLILALSRHINNGFPPCWVEMLLFELGKTHGIIDENISFTQEGEKQQSSKTPPAEKSNKTIGTHSEMLKDCPSSLLSHFKYRNNNGRMLLYPKKLTPIINETFCRGGLVQLEIDGVLITIKKKTKDYRCFRQKEINAWAKNKEEAGKLKDKDTLSATLHFILGPACES